MAIRKIVKHPDKGLEKKCRKVTSFGPSLHKLLDDLYDTMIDADGLGIAAPQVGVDLAVAIVDMDDEHGTLELINPEIIQTEGSSVDVEGCLSFPGIYGEVERPDLIKVRAQDRDGDVYELEVNEYFSRAIQHEVDHLNGVLFTSKVIRYIQEDELEGYGEE